MKPGNTLNPDRLPSTEGLLHQVPIKLSPEAGKWANFHCLGGLAGGFIGSVILELMGPRVSACFDTFEIAVLLTVLLLFTMQFVAHFSRVCAADLRRSEVQGAIDSTFSHSCLVFLLLPLYLPVALWRSMKHADELRRAWVSYLNYDSFDAGNPGILHNPGGALLTRLAMFHLTIWVVSMSVLNLPAPHLTEVQLRHIGWWLCPPLLLGPPLLVMLVASLVLSVNLGKLKEMRND